MHSRVGILLAIASSLLVSAPARADLPAREGWPIETDVPRVDGYFFPSRGVAIADVDAGAPGLEIVAPSGDWVFAWTASGLALAGWPVQIEGTAQLAPSVADLDGDGVVEIVQVARGGSLTSPSAVYAWHADGSTVSGFPVAFRTQVTVLPTLADLDGDRALELIVSVSTWPPQGKVGVLELDGTLRAGWPVELDSNPLGAVAVGDVDGDGALEIVHLSSGELAVRSADADARAGFPIEAELDHAFDGAVVLADLDAGRPGLEIIVGDRTTSSAPGMPATVRVLAFDATGAPLDGFPIVISEDAVELEAPVVGDLDGDGRPEIVLPVIGDGIAIVRPGAPEPSTKISHVDISASVMLVDVDGDGSLEIIADDRGPDSSPGFLRAFREDGSEVDPFPLRPTGTTTGKHAAIADIDDDGALDLVVPSSDAADAPKVWFHLWALPGAHARANDWKTQAHDVQRTNCVGACVPSDAGETDDAGPAPDAEGDAGIAVDSGFETRCPASECGSPVACGCRATPWSRRPRDLIAIAGLLATLALRRRFAAIARSSLSFGER